MAKRKRSSKETAARRTSKQRTKVRSGPEPAPVKTDDPARDKSEMEGSVLQPLPHAD
jgi:hypothetical protein